MANENEYGLTEKQERFCQAIIEFKGNQSEAYRAAYDTESMSDNTIWVKASELAGNGKVTVRIQEIRKKLIENGIHSLEESLLIDVNLIGKYQKHLETLEKEDSSASAIKAAKRAMAFIGSRAYNGAMDRVAKKLGFFDKHQAAKGATTLNYKIIPPDRDGT